MAAAGTPGHRGWLADFGILFGQDARDDAATYASLGRAKYRGGDLALEQSRESARGRTLSAQPPVNVTLQNNLKVMIDGHQIAAIIEGQIVQKTDHPVQAPAFDGRSTYAAPDYNYATG